MASSEVLGRTLADTETLSGYERLAVACGIRRVLTRMVEIPAPMGMIAQISAIAVLRNPWTGSGPSEDLGPESRRIAPVLARVLTDRVIHAAVGVARIEAFGKAAVVGSEGDLEHAAALIHTPYFGNLVREALDGTSVLCFADGRMEPGDTIRVPVWHKTAATTRSHYQSLDVPLQDAPLHDELAVILAVATGPRPHARIGDRRTDLPVTSEILKEIPL